MRPSTSRPATCWYSAAPIHNWVNRGTEPCVIAFVLIAAKPVTVGGKVLHAQG
jgi:hypothetical protein